MRAPLGNPHSLHRRWSIDRVGPSAASTEWVLAALLVVVRSRVPHRLPQVRAVCCGRGSPSSVFFTRPPPPLLLPPALQAPVKSCACPPLDWLMFVYVAPDACARSSRLNESPPAVTYAACRFVRAAFGSTGSLLVERPCERRAQHVRSLRKLRRGRAWTTASSSRCSMHGTHACAREALILITHQLACMSPRMSLLLIQRPL